MAKIGIRDVAERAGVALGTVSRVLNDHPSVTPELRARVKAVIEELHYHPDPNAQSMRSKVSRLLGIVVPDITNPYFAELVQSTERSAMARGLSVIVMSSQEDAAAEADRIRALASRKVDGVVLVPTAGFHAVGAPKGLPLVIIDREISDRPLVAADHRPAHGSRSSICSRSGTGGSPSRRGRRSPPPGATASPATRRP